MKKRLLAIGLLSIFALSACGKTEESVSINNTEEKQIVVAHDRETVDKAIDKIITDEYYGRADVIARDVKQLMEIDTASGERWQEITDFWAKINERDFVNMDELPDDLPDDNSLCIVVMGYCLNPDGSMRDELIGRLETAVKAANKYKNAYVLVTGGPTASDDKTATEADSMAGWLKDNGIAEERIIVENRSLTSATNAIYSYDILEKDYPYVKNVVIVTSEYHVPLGSLLYNTEFILRESNIRVISNAAYRTGNNHVFDRRNQADWIRKLLDNKQ